MKETVTVIATVRRDAYACRITHFGGWELTIARQVSHKMRQEQNTTCLVLTKQVLNKFYYIPNYFIDSPDINAKWEDWSNWSTCSISCGGNGTKTRTRSCLETTFDCGNPCSDLKGNTTDSATCTTDPCPGKQTRIVTLSGNRYNKSLVQINKAYL